MTGEAEDGLTMSDSPTAQPEPDGRFEGLQCPDCGCSRLPVVYTRHRDRRTLRVRRCQRCGRRVQTYEQLAAARGTSRG